MREAFQILLEKLCCFGIGGIAVFLFVRATYDKWKMKNGECRMQQNIFHFPFSILHLQGAGYPSAQDSTPIA